MKIILLIALTMTTLTWGQTMDKMNNKDKFKYVFEHLDKDSMHLIDEFYDQNVEFIDPIGQMKGSKNIKRYYQELYKNVKTIRFDFSEFVENGDTIVGVWKMTLVTPKLNSGDPIVVDGNSVIKFKNGKAIYHRDFFDMGEFIYENIPVLGFLVKKIKERFELKQ